MAAQAIGSLFVALGLDSAAFQAGIKQVQGQIGRFADGLNKRLSALGNVPGVRSLQAALSAVSANAAVAFGAMAATATVALGTMSVSAINAAKEIKNLSSLAGATPEEFQRVAYAAEQVGISQEKMSDILKDVNDRVGDFIATGGGPMKDFFERVAPLVGVTADQFRKLSGPQALQLYVDSLEKANLNQQDFTFFMEAMASDSTALVPILRNGGAAAKAYGDRLEALGGVMDNATVARLASMKSALSDVGVVMSGIKNQLGAAFAPVIEAMAQSFTRLMMRGSAVRVVFDAMAAVVSKLATLFSSVTTIIGSVASAVWHVVQAFGSWINEATGVGAAITWLWDHTVGFVADLVIGFADLIKSAGGFGEAMALLGEVAVGVWEGIVESAKAIPAGLSAVWLTIKAGFISMLQYLATQWANFLHSIVQGMQGIPGMEDAALALHGFAVNAGTAVGEFKLAADEARVAAEAAAKSAGDHLSAGFGKANEALGKLRATSDETTSSLGGMNGSTGLAAAADSAGSKGKGASGKLSKLQEVMKALREEAEKLRATMGMTDLQAEIWGKQKEAGVSASSEAGKVISDTLTQIDGLKKLKEATDDWRDSISSAFSEFILKGGSFKQMLSQIIGKLAEMVFSSGFQNLFNGLGGGGILGGILGSLGIGANADGTNNWRGGLTQVNERGGEIMNLPSGTQIIPHDISKRMADGAASRSQSIQIGWDDSIGNFRATVRDEAGRVVAQATPGMVGQAVAATYRRAQEVPIG